MRTEIDDPTSSLTEPFHDQRLIMQAPSYSYVQEELQ
jgi:hypothetical protein